MREGVLSVLINKINNISFEGYRHLINNVGEHVYEFYPKSAEQDVTLSLYRFNSGEEKPPVKTIMLKDSGIVNIDALTEFDKNENISYKLLSNGQIIESGTINRNATYPLVRGQGILTMPDSHRPGAYYADFNAPDTGKVHYDINKQRISEETIRTFSNRGGGSLAGIEYDIDEWKQMGVKKVFMTPIWAYDTVSGHHYWNKNDMQIPDSAGSIENYETMLRKFYKNGIQYVDDIAITSEGIEGLHVQYALRWANQKPQTYHWFRLNGLENEPLGLGVVPKNKNNLRHRIVNPSVIYNPQANKIEKNPNYDSNKETYFQIYDISQVTDEQLKQTDKLIDKYENTVSENKLAINNSNDTIVPYAFEIKPSEYENRLNELVKINKNAENKINLDSPEGTLFIGQFTNFKIEEDATGAVFWDANKDIFKRNYYTSGYDEKLINAIPNHAQRDNMREILKRANCEVQDIAIQAGIYRTQLVKDVQTLYTAQALKNAHTKDEIDLLIGKSLPEEAKLDSETIENILDGWYNLERKQVEPKEDVTLRALMKLPLDALELGDNTVGVLATSFFTNRATNEENIGISRYEFYKQGAGVYAPYHKTYHDIDNLYATKLKDFTYEVINKVNQTSPEKLLDSNGNYTEYGEYVIDLLGKDIAKYAFLKAVAGKNLQAKIMPDDVLRGKLTYNYSNLREKTTLKALGINATSPEEEAKALEKIISNGLSKLNMEDIELVAESISKQIEGTTTKSFRLAEAMVGKASLGLDFRLDAAKDVVDMDAVRNGTMSFDEAWDQVIDFWKKYVSAIKKVNPNAYIVAEITDLDDLMRRIYGQNANVWDMDLSQAGGKYKNVPDALRAFFEETGITSEASYSYTFTDLLKVFSADGEHGDISNNGINNIKWRMEALINSNNLDYIRNLWTFADNHDKPSVHHVMALDMELFHTNNLEPNFRESIEKFNDESYEQRSRNSRISVLQELTNSDKFEDLPLEAMMNIDNKEYFKTVNTRSAAMSKLIRNAINDTIPNSFSKKDLLKSALVDLTNGNYLKDAKNLDIRTINIPALNSLESSLDEILSKSGLNLSVTEKKAIINNAKQRKNAERFAVRGDFDWENGNHWTAKELQERAKTVLGNDEFDFMKYSPYTVSVAALLLDSYKEIIGDKNTANFVNGTREFVHKYQRSVVEASRTPLPYTSDSSTVRLQNAYAARDIETVINMVIQQAEYKSGKKFSKYEHDYIMKEVFQSATEPAVQKALMYSSFLSALPGIPSVFYRDILGGLGYDEKAKNIYLQSRNTVKYSQIEEDGPLKEYRTKIFNAFREILQIRNADGLNAINDGTPYVLDTKLPDTMAMLYQDGDDIAITVLNAKGINPRNRIEYDKNSDSVSINNNNKYVPVEEEVELDEIIIPATIALAAGTVFVCAIGNDKAEYIIEKAENGLYKLVRKDGKKIKLNGKTTKWGAMFLKKISKNFPKFKGKNINQQYNIVSNPYKQTNKSEMGKNLSVISG